MILCCHCQNSPVFFSSSFFVKLKYNQTANLIDFFKQVLKKIHDTLLSLFKRNVNFKNDCEVIRV